MSKKQSKELSTNHATTVTNVPHASVQAEKSKKSHDSTGTAIHFADTASNGIHSGVSADSSAGSYSKTKAWKELKQDLNIPAQATPDHVNKVTVPSEAKDLENQVLQLWQQHDKSESQLAPVLYDFCQKLNAQGKKGAGFQAWLKEHKKPRSTAYRWINSYVKREGLESPLPPKTEKANKSTLSHVGQGQSSVVVPDTAPFIAPPTTVAEAITVLNDFLGKVPKEKQIQCATELKMWLEVYVSEFSESASVVIDHA